jgi:hypothetical protein
MKLSPTFQRRAPWIAAVVTIAAYYPRFIKEAGGLLFYPAAAECMLRGETPLHCKTTLFAYPSFLPCCQSLWWQCRCGCAKSFGISFSSVRLSHRYDYAKC